MLPDGRPCRHAHHLAMLLSLCLPPQCPPCCARCVGRRHARYAALAVPATATVAVTVAGLTGTLPDVHTRRRRHARCSSVAYAATMLAEQQSLLRVPLCLPSSFLVSFDTSLIWSSSASRCQC
ncbi:hypothetical protein PF005_g24893 [Phytophthora fragariae]|uniref:Secreted protein n=1 Tax=Phytophthora fragariae TaxID=53985 RepID=A0A6A4CMN1_9STRA|nr:hypothetical protein PF009_g20249 [Phytophthora fragariae]KAE8963660.1 hypothetical protein PF011_g28952 [Phytophthora fragariae]KAE9090024.1 hypothetical protein PF007_g19395 [Phytophthora fragariae]KAE9096675.1 hypothetical protein PF006_g23728 [Phytophthora fragariae]KAE9176546.1 hypothetical protein PF005_g24893 [Phytophthora fragariae]